MSWSMEIIGPGIWYVMHTEGARSNSNRKSEVFRSHTKEIVKTLYCTKCRRSARTYYETHPIKKFEIIDGIPSDFIWTWKFHNFVNKKLNKRIMPLKEAWSLYNPASIYLTEGYLS